MGVSNQTCAVTHMPIEEGDDVACFLLVRTEESVPAFGGFTNTGAAWKTISLPFYGAYDGLGSVRDVEEGAPGPTNRAVLGRSVTDFLKEAEETGQPPKVSHHSLGDDCEVRLMMVHSEVWHRLSGECRTPQGQHVQTYLEERRIPEFIEFVRDLSREHYKNAMRERGPFRPFSQAHDACQIWHNRNRGQGYVPFAARFFTPHQSGGIHPFLRIGASQHFGRLLMAGDGNLKEVAEGIDCCLFTEVFDHNMAALRRTWAPQSGLGSQATNYDLHDWVGSWVQGKCADKRELYDAESASLAI